MEITLDFSGIPTNNPIDFAWWIFIHGGWIIPLLFLVWACFQWWLAWIRNNYRKTRKYILLAIDIPKDNEQTPRAVENMFNHLAGAHQSSWWKSKWWDGEVNDSFSFEIISLEGYIQFIVQTRDVYRDLIEAIIYAQYPNAEITEIEDYVQRHKDLRFPDEKYQLWGTEVVLAANEVYPIITCREFEDSISQEIKDPMASILEALSRLGKGEEIWLQFVVTPADNDWGTRAKPVIDKLIGAKVERKKDIIDKIGEIPGFILDSILTSPEGSGGSDSGKNDPNKLQYMTKGETDAVSAIQHKIGKIGFHTTIRYVYIAEKEKFVKQRAVQGVYGAFKQYNDLGLNSFKPDKKTVVGGTMLFFKDKRLDKRRRKILNSYVDRANSLNPGDYGKILNVEELASLWHFPMITVKTPLIKRSESKKAEPPMGLPIDYPTSPIHPADTTKESTSQIGEEEAPSDTTIKGTPPPNLPIG